MSTHFSVWDLGQELWGWTPYCCFNSLIFANSSVKTFLWTWRSILIFMHLRLRDVWKTVILVCNTGLVQQLNNSWKRKGMEIVKVLAKTFNPIVHLYDNWIVHCLFLFCAYDHSMITRNKSLQKAIETIWLQICSASLHQWI